MKKRISKNECLNVFQKAVSLILVTFKICTIQLFYRNLQFFAVVFETVLILYSLCCHGNKSLKAASEANDSMMLLWIETTDTVVSHLVKIFLKTKFFGADLIEWYKWSRKRMMTYSHYCLMKYVYKMFSSLKCLC